MNLQIEKKITSCVNPLIKNVCALRRSADRKKENAFIIEGKKLFAEACQWQIHLTDVFVTEEFLSGLSNVLSDYLSEQKDKVILVSDAVMEKLSGQKHSEGIICRGENSKKFGKNPLSYVILEDVQDPGNVGTIIRTADAAGFDGVLTTEETADVYNEKVLRASMGSVFHMSIEQHCPKKDLLSRLKKNGFTIIGSSLEGSEQLFLNFPSDIRPAVILGNESRGMSSDWQKQCDLLVRIPMSGNAESLNVGVAAGLMLYKAAGLV